MTVRGFLGGLLIFIGGTGALLSGGCTLSFMLGSVADSNFSAQNMGLFLMVGGIPFLVSLVVLWAGKAILKHQKLANSVTADDE